MPIVKINNKDYNTDTLSEEAKSWAVSGLEDTLLRCQIQPEYLNGHYQKEVQQGI